VLFHGQGHILPVFEGTQVDFYGIPSIYARVWEALQLYIYPLMEKFKQFGGSGNADRHMSNLKDHPPAREVGIQHKEVIKYGNLGFFRFARASSTIVLFLFL